MSFHLMIEVFLNGLTIDTIDWEVFSFNEAIKSRLSKTQKMVFFFFLVILAEVNPI